MNNIENIQAIIVLYKTDYRDSASFQSIARSMEGYDEVLDLLIYDNSPESATYEEEFQQGNIRIKYKHDPRNSGVSAAYNYGAKFARNNPLKHWLLLLDQDTSFSADIIEKYLEAFVQHPTIKLFAPLLKLKSGILFSPCRFIFKRGFTLEKINPGPSSLRGISPVNSGMMIALDAFVKAGMYNEAVKLDFSDFQFIERLKKTESTFVVVNSTGFQDFSNDETNVRALDVRFAYFCQGARNFDKFGQVDNIQFFIVAFMRAVTLSLRTRSLIFFKTFYNNYIKG